MPSKRPVIIALILFTWSILSYFLLIRQTTFDSNSLSSSKSSNEYISASQLHAIQNQLNDLERSIHEESKHHEYLVKKLLLILQLNRENEDRKAISQISAGAIESSNGKNHVQSNGVGSIAIPATEKKNNAETNEIDFANAAPIGGEEITTSAEDSQTILHYKLKKLTKDYLNIIDFKGPVIPILVFACNRISVRNCLENLIRYRPNARQFPIIVSQDCNDEATQTVIESFDEVTLMQQPDQSDIFVLPKDKKFKGYYKISRHYGWALNTTFKAGFDYVVIVEDDLNVAPDFYEYFLATHELLKNDSSLWCISAWNDNGKAANIDLSRPDLLYRTDFFPGLGWMLSSNLWNELSPKWPKAFWDDWIRHPEQRKKRVCIRPEIPRTRTFGKIGVSNGLFFEKHLKFIKLNEELVSFTKLNLTYLLKDNYDKEFISHVYSRPVITFEELRRGLVKTTDSVRIQYNTKDQYKRTAKMLGLMDDFKSGVPRTGYHGIVSMYYKNQRVYLAPNINWKGYDLSWS